MTFVAVKALTEKLSAAQRHRHTPGKQVAHDLGYVLLIWGPPWAWLMVASHFLGCSEGQAAARMIKATPRPLHTSGFVCVFFSFFGSLCLQSQQHISLKGHMASSGSIPNGSVKGSLYLYEGSKGLYLQNLKG